MNRCFSAVSWVTQPPQTAAMSTYSVIFTWRDVSHRIDLAHTERTNNRKSYFFCLCLSLMSLCGFQWNRIVCIRIITFFGKSQNKFNLHWRPVIDFSNSFFVLSLVQSPLHTDIAIELTIFGRWFDEMCIDIFTWNCRFRFNCVDTSNGGHFTLSINTFLPVLFFDCFGLFTNAHSLSHTQRCARISVLHCIIHGKWKKI